MASETQAKEQVRANKQLAASLRELRSANQGLSLPLLGNIGLIGLFTGGLFKLSRVAGVGSSELYRLQNSIWQTGQVALSSIVQILNPAFRALASVLESLNATPAGRAITGWTTAGVLLTAVLVFATKTVVAFVKVAVNFIRTILTWPEKIGNAVKWLAQFAGRFRTVTTVARTLAPWLTRIGLAFAVIGKVALAVATVLGISIGWAVALVLGAFALLGVGIYLLIKNWDDVKKYLTGTFIPALLNFSTIHGFIYDLIKGKVKDTLVQLGVYWANFTTWFASTPFGKIVVGIFNSVWDKAVQITMGGINKIITAINKLFAKLRAIRIQIPVGFSLDGGIQYASVAPFKGLSNISPVGGGQPAQGTTVNVTFTGTALGKDIDEICLLYTSPSPRD